MTSETLRSRSAYESKELLGTNFVLCTPVLAASASVARTCSSRTLSIQKMTSQTTKTEFTRHRFLKDGASFPDLLRLDDAEDERIRKTSLETMNSRKPIESKNVCIELEHKDL